MERVEREKNYAINVIDEVNSINKHTEQWKIRLHEYWRGITCNTIFNKKFHSSENEYASTYKSRHKKVHW